VSENLEPPVSKMILGKVVRPPKKYSPDLLQCIARENSRKDIIPLMNLPFVGEDLWHAYELSWIDKAGKPIVYAGHFTIPCNSPFLIESKSLKLYLNSINNNIFDDSDTARNTIAADLSNACEAAVEVILYQLDDSILAGNSLNGDSIDHCVLRRGELDPLNELLIANKDETVRECLYSHYLRSVCPVTKQPDWGTLWIEYKGSRIDRSGLLTYICSLRNLEGFHEHCIEKIFLDLYSVCKPDELSVRGLYNRRGGLNISPWRSTHFARGPVYRINRQ